MRVVQNYFSVLFQNWGEALRNKRTLGVFLLTMASYVFLFKYCRVAMAYFETRQGVQLNDFILALLPSFDFSLLTFSLTYFALFFFILCNVRTPDRFIRGMQAYTLLLLLRTLTIYLVPLEPPAKMIVLRDPVSNFFLNSGEAGGYIVKDLFFSGHISAIALFYFVTENKIAKRILLSLAIIIAALILLQHVHYVIDVAAAPFFSSLAYRCTLFVNQKPQPRLLFRRKS